MTRTAVATADRKMAFYSGRRWHVLAMFGFAVCGAQRQLGAQQKPAKDVPEAERCRGGCRTSWPESTDG